MRFVIRGALLAVCAVLVVLWIVTALTSGDRSPFLNDWLVTLVFLLMTLPFAFRQTSTPSDREFAGGQFGVGTVVSVRRTGTTVNDQPEMDVVMDVETVTGETFRATGRRLVDLTTLSELVPGVLLPVRYAPGRKDGRVMIDLEATGEQMHAHIQEAAFARGETTARSMENYRHGFATTALVLAMRPTGEVRDGAAVIDLQYRVTRPDGTTFDTRRELEVPPIGIADVQPGRIVNARYLLQDESDVSVEIRVG